MPCSIRPVRFTEILAAEALLAEYAHECSIAEIGEVNPQPEMYADLERADIVQMFGAFDGDTLVGFASVIHSILPHYGRKVATLESLFVRSESRQGGTGWRLMREVEQHAKMNGCTAVLYSAPAGGKLEKMLDVMKRYKRTNAVFCRRLT